MHHSAIAVFSVALTVLGLSYVLRARAWATLYVEREQHPERFVPTGFLMVIGGLCLAVTVNDWSSTWPIFITAFGWLMAIEGALLSCAPALVGGFTRLLGDHLALFIRLGGLLVFGLGCLLCWEYLIRGQF